MKQAVKYPTEHAEQVRIFKWATLSKGRYPQLELLFAVPNGSYKSFTARMKFQAEGLRSGVPDIVLPAASPKKHHGLYIELKRVKGGKVSPEQEWWLERLTEQGYYAVVCKGADEAIKTIIDYLEGKL